VWDIHFAVGPHIAFAEGSYIISYSAIISSAPDDLKVLQCLPCIRVRVISGVRWILPAPLKSTSLDFQLRLHPCPQHRPDSESFFFGICIYIAQDVNNNKDVLNCQKTNNLGTNVMLSVYNIECGECGGRGKLLVTCDYGGGGGGGRATSPVWLTVVIWEGISLPRPDAGLCFLDEIG
jgi:hypothetical protein